MDLINGCIERQFQLILTPRNTWTKSFAGPEEKLIPIIAPFERFQRAICHYPLASPPRKHIFHFHPLPLWQTWDAEQTSALTKATKTNRQLCAKEFGGVGGDQLTDAAARQGVQRKRPLVTHCWIHHPSAPCSLPHWGRTVSEARISSPVKPKCRRRCPRSLPAAIVQ